MRNPGRPLSPHLTIWKWGPHMAVSIFHRATGAAMATAGVIIFTWWLVAAASGADAYAKFVGYMALDGSGPLSFLPAIVLIGLTWTFFQHLCSGLRHFVLDTGAGYELRINKMFAMGTFAASILLTVAFWAAIYARG